VTASSPSNPASNPASSALPPPTSHVPVLDAVRALAFVGDLPVGVKVGTVLVMAAVAIWLWLRPEP